VARVLVVDDDPRLVKVVSRLLWKRNHQVESVSSGEQARQVLRGGDIDIVLLDVNLPDVNGIALVHRLREEGDTTPVILLTVRTEMQDQALALRLGGDDYIVKPFNPELLLARIQAVLRRSARDPVEGTAGRQGEHLEIPPIVMDITARQVFRDGVPVRLTPLEYAVLEFLAANRGRAVSKEELMLSVWGTSQGVSRTLTEHVSRLRRKLGENLISTQSGYGYLIPDPAEPTATDR
jgi:DNA-binding response OmpR family regulator